MPVFRDERRAPLAGHVGGERQGVGNDAALGIAGGGELRGLRHILAQHQGALQGVPESGVAQSLFGAGAIGGVFRIGDGKAANLPLGQRVAQSGQGRVNLQGRALRRQQRQASDGIERAFVLAQALRSELGNKGFVGREKHLKRGAFDNLAIQIPRRTKHQLHVLAGLRGELRPHFFQRELQV